MSLYVAPLPPIHLETPQENVTNSSLLATWTMAPDMNMIDGFNISVLSTDGKEKILKSSNSSQHSMLVRGLQPGTEYNVSVQAIAHGLLSTPTFTMQATSKHMYKTCTFEFFV